MSPPPGTRAAARSTLVTAMLLTAATNALGRLAQLPRHEQTGSVPPSGSWAPRSAMLAGTSGNAPHERSKSKHTSCRELRCQRSQPEHAPTPTRLVRSTRMHARAPDRSEPNPRSVLLAIFRITTRAGSRRYRCRRCGFTFQGQIVSRDPAVCHRRRVRSKIRRRMSISPSGRSWRYPGSPLGVGSDTCKGRHAHVEGALLWQTKLHGTRRHERHGSRLV